MAKVMLLKLLQPHVNWGGGGGGCRGSNLVRATIQLNLCFPDMRLNITTQHYCRISQLQVLFCCHIIIKARVRSDLSDHRCNCFPSHLNNVNVFGCFHSVVVEAVMKACFIITLDLIYYTVIYNRQLSRHQSEHRLKASAACNVSW